MGVDLSIAGIGQLIAPKFILHSLDFHVALYSL